MIIINDRGIVKITKYIYIYICYMIFKNNDYTVDVWLT